MRCPVCKEIDLEITKEIPILYGNRVYFSKCNRCSKTFVRHTEFAPSGLLSCDILLLLEDGKTTLYKELYRK